MSVNAEALAPLLATACRLLCLSLFLALGGLFALGCLLALGGLLALRGFLRSLLTRFLAALFGGCFLLRGFFPSTLCNGHHLLSGAE